MEYYEKHIGSIAAVKKIGIIIMVCLSGMLLYLRVDAGKRQVQAVAEINLMVHQMLAYGDMSGNINEVIEAGQGHCGHYAVIMAYKLRERGIDCDIADLRSASYQAVHSVLECRIAGDTYVFDPTNAVYYRNSIQELRECPKLADKAVYQMDQSDVILMYVKSYFWAGIYNVNRICSLVHMSGDGYDTTHLNNLSMNIISAYLQGNELEKSRLTDNKWKTSLTITDKEAEIYLEVQTEVYGVLALDFINGFENITDIGVVCHDVLSDTWNPVSYADRGMSHFEFYLENRCIDQIKIQVKSSDVIALHEIVLTEGML